MEKTTALWVLLLPQPLFAYVFWGSIQKLFEWFGLEDKTLFIAATLSSAILYGVFVFLFARGFLASSQAKKLGF